MDKLSALDTEPIATEFGIGKYQMIDLIRAIRRPTWDPRDKADKPLLRRSLLKIADLKPEMQLDARVVNVVDFGVFVDIGLGESCLVHVSQLSSHYISDPQVIFSVGDLMKVWVTDLDTERRRVKLTAVRPGTKKSRPPRGGKGNRGGDGSSKATGETRPRKYGTPKPKSGKFSGGGRSDSRGGRREGGHGGRSGDNRNQKFARRPSKPKPVIPITDEMLTGDAPMRSFSDLLQFKKKDPVKPGGKKAGEGKKSPENTNDSKKSGDGDSAPG